MCGCSMRVNYRVERNGPVRVYKCRKSAPLTSLGGSAIKSHRSSLQRLSRDDGRALPVDYHLIPIPLIFQRLSAVNLRLEGPRAVKAKAQQADLEAQMAHTDRAPVLADLVSAKDVRGKWNAIGLDRQRAAIDLLCTVLLLRDRTQ